MKAKVPSTTIIPFGKYKGRTLDEIFEEDPAYLGWCIEEGIEFMDNLTPAEREDCESAYHEQEFIRDRDEMYLGYFDDWGDR